MNGDGGNGGFAVSGGAAIGGTVSVGLGGSGAKGGKASAVSVKAQRRMSKLTKTSGESSTGILAQSLGGSGGNGGFSAAAGASANLYPSASGRRQSGRKRWQWWNCWFCHISFKQYSDYRRESFIRFTGTVYWWRWR